MSAATVVVLYEDQQNSSGAKPFGLHELVVSLVADALEEDRHTLKNRIDGRPLKSNNKVLVQLEAADDVGGGAWVIGLFDEDRVRDMPQVALPASASEDQAVNRLFAVTGASTRRSVTLLVRNMETVISAAAACDPSLDADWVERALRKKLNERDLVLNRVAHGPEPVRTCIAERVPSLLELRDRIICALA
jgi:hypothetical protein